MLVASPNDGTPLATPKRWDETIGWMANLLELFPDNPFTSGAAFVAHGLNWLANHASGDLPGLHSMDAEGDVIAAIQREPGPPPDAYAALVASYEPTGETLQRLLDIGIDRVLLAPPTTWLFHPRVAGGLTARTRRSFRRRESDASALVATCRRSDARELFFSPRDRGVSRQCPGRPPPAAGRSRSAQETSESSADSWADRGRDSRALKNERRGRSRRTETSRSGSP